MPVPLALPTKVMPEDKSPATTTELANLKPGPLPVAFPKKLILAFLLALILAPALTDRPASVPLLDPDKDNVALETEILPPL